MEHRQTTNVRSKAPSAGRAAEDWAACATLLRDGIADLGLKVTASQRDQLIQYLQELAHWNSSYNLTAVRVPAEMVVKHLLDSLAVLPFIEGESLLDVGAGAGLPGIPLAIVRPKRAVTLLDSNGKKAAFQRHALRTLKLDNVRVVQSRVEDYKPEQPFDTVTARAFTSLPEFAALCAPLTSTAGRLVAMLGQLPAHPEAAAPAGFTLQVLAPLAVPGLHAERHVAVFARGLL